MTSLEKKYQSLLEPSTLLKSDMQKLEGDIMILGVGGKMGPSLAILAKKTLDSLGLKNKVIGVARFSEAGLENELKAQGIEAIQADLLNDEALYSLPQVKNILYLAGTKFGTSGNESFTWAMNAYLPGRVATKFKGSRIVVFSTGNVYPFTSVESGGATETTLPAPIGEYAQSCLGRERMFQYFSNLNHTPILIYRLNYANDVSYGVLLEIAKAVRESKPIDLAMGYVNVIWQNDANEIALRSLWHCQVPAKILNVTGNQTLSVRKLAIEFGKRLDKVPVFKNDELPTALLSNASESERLFGISNTSLEQMMDIILEWLVKGGKTINKPTHFSERTGNF
ncbi:MAG: epimerase [Saprospiraceae bacterium]